MSSLLSLILFSYMVITCYSAVFLERQLAITGHENECYDQENNVFHKKGEIMKWNAKICGRKICRGSDGRGRVYAETHTCGKTDIPPHCHVEVNLQLSYPNCCERLVCPKVLYLENSTT